LMGNAFEKVAQQTNNVQSNAEVSAADESPPPKRIHAITDQGEWAKLLSAAFNSDDESASESDSAQQASKSGWPLTCKRPEARSAAKKPPRRRFLQFEPHGRNLAALQTASISRSCSNDAYPSKAPCDLSQAVKPKGKAPQFRFQFAHRCYRED